MEKILKALQWITDKFQQDKLLHDKAGNIIAFVVSILLFVMLFWPFYILYNDDET